MTVTLTGVGLHSGEACEVACSRTDGEVVLARGDRSAAVPSLRVVRADRGVQVALGPDDDAPTIDLVEHALGALAGLSVRRGVRLEVTGPEVPLLDGGAALLARAVASLGPTPSPLRLEVTREAVVDVGHSRYHFSPTAGVEVEVRVDFPGVGPQSASFRGSRDEFLSTIAPARTFGYRREAEALRAVGRARHADASAVIVLEDDGAVLEPFGAPTEDELARHKLLDFLGDAYLFGGLRRGRVVAERPGHAATHEAFEWALRDRILAETRNGG